MPKQAQHFSARGGSTGYNGPFVALDPLFPTGAPSDEHAFVCVSYHMSPAEARRLSADLLEAADEAEKAKP